MKKMHRFTLILTLVLLESSLFIPSASALLPKTYTVNSSASDSDANPGNGICATTGGKCTLYAAIQEANADGVYSTINFVQKFQSPSSIHGCGLPTITEEGTTIDASNQWDTAYDRPGVEIIGLGCTLLTISANHTTILGLFFSGGDNAGVEIYGSFNSIGGINTGQRNVFIAGVVGVYILGGTSNAIANNYFGTINGATSIGSGTKGIGILVQGGNYTTISDNLIVGQSDCGIEVVTSNNTVTENIIGMSSNKSTALPNKVGIILAWGGGNTIGPGNVIVGNTSHGLYLKLDDNNDIKGNYIGYAGMGNGGDGIHLHVSDNNRITEGNVIANNTGNGIYAILSSDITIQGSYVDSNSQVGIYFEGCSNSLIGGTGDNQLNSIGGNQSHGIHLNASSTITVTSNYIGLLQGAFEWGNLGNGILVDKGSHDNTIGDRGFGGFGGEGNWIGWNHLNGVELDGSNTCHNYVVGNAIGAPINFGWEAPNYNHGVGIYNGAYDNYIGEFRGGGNLILASGWSGVAIVGSNNNWVSGNRIGTDGGDGTDWGNAFYGITVSGSGNTIKNNEIANNGTYGRLNNGAQAGVLVDGVTSIDNMITQNSIYDNDGPGIRLDNSGNHNLAAPVITSASCSQVQVTACASCLVEIYSDADDEGRVYEGSLTMPRTGYATWNGTLHGPDITALAIGPDSSMDTSPFSAPFAVGVCP